MTKVLDTNEIESTRWPPTTRLSSLSQRRILAALCDFMGQTGQGAFSPATWQPGQVLELHAPPGSYSPQESNLGLCHQGGPLMGGKYPKGWEKKQSKGK